MPTKKICVALQGGGAHGAFTWGVLDGLLEEESLEIEAVSGTSAGAVNGAVLVDALKHGGRRRARERLEAFWRGISAAGDRIFKPGRTFFPVFGPNSDWSPLAFWSDLVSLVWSPYDNPFYVNMLAEVIREHLPDCSALNDSSTPHLFLCATNVKTNRRKIFGPGEISADALTASACLPTSFRSVPVNGEFYWDGGYMGNPALQPLRNPTHSPDLLIIWINPLEHPKVPTNAREILDRLNEVTFNAALQQEIEAIDAVNELKANATASGSVYKRTYLHEIRDEPSLVALGLVSKSNTEWSFLLELRAIGRPAAERWLSTGFDKVGREGSADVRGILRCLESS